MLVAKDRDPESSMDGETDRDCPKVKSAWAADFQSFMLSGSPA